MDVCPVCSWQFVDGNFRSVAYPTVPGKERPTSIRFCGQCGLGTAFPMPSAEMLQRLYQGEYWPKVDVRAPPLFPVPFALAQARWRLIEKSLKHMGKTKNLKALDIGAGHGYVGMMASKSRCAMIESYTAVEPDPTLRQYMSSSWLAKRLKSRLETVGSLDKVSGQFDVVVLSHILEHLADPLTFLKRTMMHLPADGLLFVDVPNQDYLFKQDVFPHLLFFSPDSLRYMLENLFLNIISLDVWGRDMNRSPLNAEAPRNLKLLGSLVQRAYPLLPNSFKVPFYGWYFGVNRKEANGTWLRALCQYRSN